MIHGQLVLVVDEPLTEEERKALRFILSDALGDFFKARDGDAEAYVDRVYGQVEYREEKIREVDSRLKLSQNLHNAAIQVEPLEVNDLHEWLDKNLKK